MQVTEIRLDAAPWDPLTLWMLARKALDPATRYRISVDEACGERVATSADLVERMARGSVPVYGVNTGFGDFAECAISGQALTDLQHNLIRSHACGMGEEVSRDIVMAMWLMRLRMLVRGYSGVRLETIRALARMLEQGILACVPSRGSVGASGDLHPSAHAALAALGEGDCTAPRRDGTGFERLPAEVALRINGLKPISLSAKEGLALINGTTFSTALAIKCWFESCKLLRLADAAAAMTMEAVGGAGAVLDPRVLSLHHCETELVGRRLASWLEGSRRMHAARNEGRFLQAPYSLRCVPQVHGAILCELEQCHKVLKEEIRSVSDNPLVFVDAGELHSCGNFHAIYPARVSDRLATALATMGTISERRINLLMDDKLTGLPKFLIRDGGLNSGLMMLQTAAAALASEAKSLCWPASVDSIPTNCDREDHVSMGAGAGLKALQVTARVRQVLTLELFCATQALDLLADWSPPPRLAPLVKSVRNRAPFVAKDCYMAGYLREIEMAIEDDELLPTDDLTRLLATPNACRAAVASGVVNNSPLEGTHCFTSLMGPCPLGYCYAEKQRCGR